ncbi:hypothetical protein BC629DRAFT_345935 [Irpex lacteus]|nr:hypothetical protein BC629DRAFT_345935 [Irpex lacteus]
MRPYFLTQISWHLKHDTNGLLTAPAYRICRSQFSALGSLFNVGASVHLQESIAFEMNGHPQESRWWLLSHPEVQIASQVGEQLQPAQAGIT